MFSSTVFPYRILLFVELVDDDTDQEVEGEEGSGHDEENEEEVGVDGVLSIRLNVHLEKIKIKISYLLPKI